MPVEHEFLLIEIDGFPVVFDEDRIAKPRVECLFRGVVRVRARRTDRQFKADGVEVVSPVIRERIGDDIIRRADARRDVGYFCLVVEKTLERLDKSICHGTLCLPQGRHDCQSKRGLCEEVARALYGSG